MKVIVATSETQGQRPGDFNFVPDGKIVTVIDCVRSMVGIKMERVRRQ